MIIMIIIMIIIVTQGCSLKMLTSGALMGHNPLNLLGLCIAQCLAFFNYVEYTISWFNSMRSENIVMPALKLVIQNYDWDPKIPKGGGE